MNKLDEQQKVVKEFILKILLRRIEKYFLYNFGGESSGCYDLSIKGNISRFTITDVKEINYKITRSAVLECLRQSGLKEIKINKDVVSGRDLIYLDGGGNIEISVLDIVLNKSQYLVISVNLQ